MITGKARLFGWVDDQHHHQQYHIRNCFGTHQNKFVRNKLSQQSRDSELERCVCVYRRLQDVGVVIMRCRVVFLAVAHILHCVRIICVVNVRADSTSSKHTAVVKSDDCFEKKKKNIWCAA